MKNKPKDFIEWSNLHHVEFLLHTYGKLVNPNVYGVIAAKDAEAKKRGRNNFVKDYDRFSTEKDLRKYIDSRGGDKNFEVWNTGSAFIYQGMDFITWKKYEEKVIGPLKNKNEENRIDDEALHYLDTLVKDLVPTNIMYTYDDNSYGLDRLKLHKKIIKKELEGNACIKREQPIAVLMGGSAGSGKSYFVKNNVDWLQDERIFKIDSDDIKAKLPEYKGWNAGQVHVEARKIVKSLIRKIGKGGCSFDVIIDGTMKNLNRYHEYIKLLKQNGYKIFVLYMDVPFEVSMERAMKRFQSIGRYVPKFIIEEHAKVGLSVFEEIKNKVDGYWLVDGVTSEIKETGGEEFPKDRDYDSLVDPNDDIKVNDIQEKIRAGQGVTQVEIREKIPVKEGDLISFNTSSNLDNPRFKGVVEFKNNFGLVVLINDKQYDLRKLIDIKKENPSKLIKGRKITINLPNGEKRNAQFAITELDNIIASHNEKTFGNSKGYPLNENGHNINDRNYTDDVNAQAIVHEYARDLKPELLVTTSRTAEGTPIIDKNRIVISGNNRTMSMKLAASDYPQKYIEYKKFLCEELGAFGFELNQTNDSSTSIACDENGLFEKFRRPVLVRIDYDFPKYTTEELAKFNQDTKKGKAPIDKAIELSNILHENKLCEGNIPSVLNSFDRMSNFYADKKAQKEMIEMFINCNLVTTQQKPEYFVDGFFTENGKNFIETVLSSLVLDKASIMVAGRAGVKSFRKAIVNALPVLMNNKGLGKDSLISDIDAAVRYQADLVNSGLSFSDFITQTKLFEVRPYNQQSIYLSRLIAKGQRIFKTSIDKYNQTIKANQGASMFPGEKVNAAEAFEKIIVANVEPKEASLIAKYSKMDHISSYYEPLPSNISKTKLDELQVLFNDLRLEPNEKKLNTFLDFQKRIKGLEALAEKYAHEEIIKHLEEGEDQEVIARELNESGMNEFYSHEIGNEVIHPDLPIMEKNKLYSMTIGINKIHGYDVVYYFSINPPATKWNIAQTRKSLRLELKKQGFDLKELDTLQAAYDKIGVGGSRELKDLNEFFHIRDSLKNLEELAKEYAKKVLVRIGFDNVDWAVKGWQGGGSMEDGYSLGGGNVIAGFEGKGKNEFHKSDILIERIFGVDVYYTFNIKNLIKEIKEAEFQKATKIGVASSSKNISVKLRLLKLKQKKVALKARIELELANKYI